MNRQRAILAALVALFACSLVYSFLRMPRQKRVEKLTYQPGMTAQPVKSAKDKDSDSVRVRLDLLDRKQGSGSVGGKNIFQALFDSGVKKPSVPLPPPPPPPEKRVEPPPVAIQVPPAPQAVEPTPLQRDMATFTFLGFLKKENRKSIFLSNGKEIFIVKKGDKISGRYDVTSLSDEAITISSLQDSGEIVIPLVENKPLTAPRR
jgi:hypothetical protein